MKQRILAAACVILLGSHVGWAQSPGPRRGPGRGFGPPRGGIDVLAVQPVDAGELVTGAPFSAETITEMTQDLPDGNRIERRTTSALARDGSGRSRREQALPSIGPIVTDAEVRIVTISDPTQRTMYLLDPNRKTAMKSRLPSGPPRGGGPRPPGPRPSGPGREYAPGSRPERPEISVERLGVREIAGARTEGTRTTTTIPAGAFGNVRPIEVTDERWYSSELKLVLESRRNDPRSGTVEYHVTNLVRGEPSAELFQVPPDYTVTERQGPPFGPPPPPRPRK